MVLLPFVGFLYGCSSSKPPQLQNLGLALDVTKFNPIPREAFFEFYGRIGDPNTGKRIPNFEYRVLQSVEIIAPTSGTIEVRETGIDQAIFLYPDDAEGWMINLDHLTQLRVATGDHVEAGQVVASPGVWSNSLGRTELQINHEDDGGKQY